MWEDGANPAGQPESQCETGASASSQLRCEGAGVFSVLVPIAYWLRATL